MRQRQLIRFRKVLQLRLPFNLSLRSSSLKPRSLFKLDLRLSYQARLIDIFVYGVAFPSQLLMCFPEPDNP